MSKYIEAGIYDYENTDLFFFSRYVLRQSVQEWSRL